MSSYYLDSSGLVKRYVNEPGSSWITSITDADSENDILLCEITLAEVTAAVSAKQRAPTGISKEDRDHVLSLFFKECREDYLLLALDRTTIDLAVDLCLRHPLRGYDAIQTCDCANRDKDLIEAGNLAITFVAADQELLKAAEKEGLATENPNLQSQA